MVMGHCCVIPVMFVDHGAERAFFLTSFIEFSQQALITLLEGSLYQPHARLLYHHSVLSFTDPFGTKSTSRRIEPSGGVKLKR